MAVTIAKTDGGYEVFAGDASVGCVSVGRNPFHGQNAYLELNLRKLDPEITEDLFELLRAELACSLQVMTSSANKELVEFLHTGGFSLRRCCYEVEGSVSDLREAPAERASLRETGNGDPAYRLCCRLLYHYYQETHKAVSPLTASEAEFCAELPVRVVYKGEGERISHAAFVEDGEIAYLCTARPEKFPAFGESLLARLFREKESVFFECDDCDPAAMALRAMFRDPGEESFDTYVYD